MTQIQLAEMLAKTVALAAGATSGGATAAIGIAVVASQTLAQMLKDRREQTSEEELAALRTSRDAVVSEYQALFPGEPLPEIPE